MANKKLAEKKTKARSKAIQQEKTKSRLFAARKARYEKELNKLERANTEKLEPIRRGSRLDVLQKNIDQNIDILKALESEYITNLKARENLQEELEAEGFNSIEEKVEAMKQKALEHVEMVQEKIIEQEAELHAEKIKSEK